MKRRPWREMAGGSLHRVVSSDRIVDANGEWDRTSWLLRQIRTPIQHVVSLE